MYFTMFVYRPVILSATSVILSATSVILSATSVILSATKDLNRWNK
jgi:hypothetical protein